MPSSRRAEIGRSVGKLKHVQAGVVRDEIRSQDALASVSSQDALASVSSQDALASVSSQEPEK